MLHQSYTIAKHGGYVCNPYIKNFINTHVIPNTMYSLVNKTATFISFVSSPLDPIVQQNRVSE